MFKFFRKIRLQLITENRSGKPASRMGKYFKYAVGEVLLVMIGILLALQVNNWNEQRKLNNQEKSYLASLKSEFENNLKDAERVQRLNKKHLEKAIQLTEYIGPGEPSIDAIEFAKLVFDALKTEVQYRPGTGVLAEILSSGKLEIFRNKKLKNALASWDGILLRVRFQEKEHGDIRLKILEFLESAEVNTRQMIFDAFGELFDIKKSKFETTYIHLLNSQEFENLIIGFATTSGFMNVNYYSKLKEEIDLILELIESELE